MPKQDRAKIKVSSVRAVLEDGWSRVVGIGKPRSKPPSSAGSKIGRFDRPGRGKVRAVNPNAADYDRDDWVRCPLAVTGDDPVDRDDAMRMAAEWASDTMGLAFVRLRSDGVIVKGFKSALNSAIRRGLVERVDGKRVRKL